MRFILIVIGSMLALDALWWFLSARLTRGITGRGLVPIFMGAQVIGLAWVIFGRLLGTHYDWWLAKFGASSVFIWHFIGLGLLVMIGCVLLLGLFIRSIARFFWRRRKIETTEKPIAGWTRREFLGFAAAVAPPLFTFSLAGVAMSQLNRFRVRHLVVPISQLPSVLDGLTIVHVSDMHVGRFTSGRVLREMVGTVNDLPADLVLLTGDLINDALAVLDEGLDLVRAIDPRSGLYLVEGNHDLIENPAEFERRVKASEIPFLLDESTTLSVRGVPIQLLGLSWTRARENRNQAIAQSVRTLLRQRRADAFPILLAHHPHAFDAAAEAGVPLTLSGHTHGGQLMLDEQVGFGPALFRYWSGLYTRGNSKLIVSNGVGNWFPLRVNAPAELIHITLRRAA